MFKFGHILNKDGTVYKPPVLKEYRDFIASLREKAKCNGHIDYRCMYCNACPSGEHFEWPPHKKNLAIQQHILEEQYFKMHNPDGISIIDLEMEVWHNPEEDEYEVETRRVIMGFGLTTDGSICFDLHLPAIYSRLFNVYKDHADATMEDLRNVVTVLHYKTNKDDKYTMLPIDLYDNLSMVACKEPLDPKKGPEYTFCIKMNMGDAQFRMMECYDSMVWAEADGDDSFRFPKDVTKFIVAVTMERRIYN